MSRGRLLILMVAVLAISTGLMGATNSVWTPVIPSYESGSFPRVAVRSFDKGIDINLETYGFTKTRKVYNNKIYTALSIPDCGFKGIPGKPQLPFKGIFLEVPNGVTLSLKIDAGEPVTTLTNTCVLPAQEPQPDCGNAPPTFVIDKDVYTLDQWMPEELASITMDAKVHGHRVVFIEIRPLQFNPAEGKVRAYPHLKVSLQYGGAVDKAAEAVKNNRRSEFFDKMVNSFISNRTEIDSLPAPKANPTGIEYLIIADDAFTEEIQPLADWKRLKGYTVEIVPTSTAGTTYTAIKNYLQTRYDSDSDLTYVLLVGDQAQIPGYVESPDAYGNSFITDLTYSLLEGSDYLPDVVLGRLSVGTVTECTNVVNKILKYERNPDTGSWYTHALIAAYLQDYNDYNCEADRYFFETGTHVMHFLEDNNLFTIHTAMTSDSLSCNPYTYRSNSSWFPHRPAGYQGEDIPTADANLITSSSQSTSDVTNAINGGVALVQHRDHGGNTGWGDPPYHTSNVNSLSNGIMTPVVFSINCLTGSFDYGSGDCFAEAFQKKASGGAVGVVAATRVSYSGHNDLLTYGIYDCFWDGFDTSDGGNSYSHSWRPAEALLYGKYYMLHWEGDTSATLYEFRLFEWFGDPEMMMRDDSQVTPTVSTNCPIPVGSSTLNVNCSVDGALVAVTDNGTLLGRATVSGGVASITLDPAPASVKTLDVVVTGHNLVPWEGTCEVIVPSAPKPVPDGKWVAGTASTASKNNSDGTSIGVSWDVSTCVGDNYNLYYGNGSNLSSYTLAGSDCDMGTSGSSTWTAPAMPGGEDFIWWVIVGTDGSSTESSWGKDSAGTERHAAASGQCGYSTKDTSGTCP